MKSLYYDRSGKPLTREAFANLFEDIDYRVVERTTVHDVEISTVWLGIDHSFNDTATPVIFETMVFGGPREGAQYRYSTVEQARAGHEKVVADVQGGRLP